MRKDNPWCGKVLTYNRAKAENREKADDLLVLLNAIPKGQVKQLLKDEVCAQILEKYGITAE